MIKEASLHAGASRRFGLLRHLCLGNGDFIVLSGCHETNIHRNRQQLRLSVSPPPPLSSRLLCICLSFYFPPRVPQSVGSTRRRGKKRDKVNGRQGVSNSRQLPAFSLSSPLLSETLVESAVRSSFAQFWPTSRTCTCAMHQQHLVSKICRRGFSGTDNIFFLFLGVWFSFSFCRACGLSSFPHYRALC